MATNEQNGAKAAMLGHVFRMLAVYLPSESEAAPNDTLDELVAMIEERGLFPAEPALSKPDKPKS